MYESINEYSRRSGLTYNAIRKMCIKNELPFITIGNKRMINVEEAEKVLLERSRGVMNECKIHRI